MFIKGFFVCTVYSNNVIVNPDSHRRERTLVYIAINEDWLVG